MNRTLDDKHLAYWQAVLARRGVTDLIPELVAGEPIGFRVVRDGQHYDYRYRPNESAEELLNRIAVETGG
jgi:hypothetical protein